VEFRGDVVRKAVAAGSKSERSAVVLRTDNGDFVLRIVGGNAFADQRLDALVGTRIRAEGELNGTTLLMRSWSEERHVSPVEPRK
jgi:hypothetical protein